MSKWYKASELERLNTPMPMDGVNGLPDNHVITVSERTIEIDESELVQNNVSTDTFTLELDAEWDDITPVVIFSNSKGDYKVAYENGPTKIPAAAMAVIGSVDVSVFGLDSTGEVRVVTKAAPNTMDVVESGKFVGEVSEDDVSLLGQILAAVEAANEAAENANATIIKSALATTLNPGEPATANLADNVLTLGIPKGEKGDKGNPGQDGVTPFTQATVTTLEPGVPATVSIGEDTLKLGIPKGEKGDKGDQGDKGETGDKGDPGTAATISVGSVTGLDAGASPTVVNSGTSTAARFDFGIPKGDKGDTGDPGHTPQRGVDYWTAEDVETVVEDAKARAVAEMAEIGNVPKATVTDLVAHAEDAYAQKPVEVRIKGRTVKNLWPAINMTQNGVAVSTDGTGLVTVTGQLEVPTQGAYSFTKLTNIVAGKNITALCSRGLPDGVYLYVSFADETGGLLSPELQVGSSSTSETQKTSTVPSGAVFARAGVGVKPGSTLEGSLTFRVMLVEGTEAPDCFTPPASITSVQPGNLVTSGKNLLRYRTVIVPGYSYTNSGITFTMQDDGGILVKGSATDAAFFNLDFYIGDVTEELASPLSPSLYRQDVTCSLAGALYTNFICGAFLGSINNVIDSIWATANKPTRKIPVGATAFRSYLMVSSGRSVNEVVYPQLELGSTATAYEPPNVVEVALPETGPLMSINGKSDVLSIASDGSVSVERHVERGDITEEVLQTGILYPSADSAPPYFACNLDITSYASADDFSKDGASSSSYSSSSRYVFTGSSKEAPEGVTRGLYRTWNSIIFWDEEFADTAQAKQLILSGGGSAWAQVPESVEQLGTVQLPQLPAPTFNQYHDSDVPSDTSTTYTRDINIALADLEAKIADLVTKEAANV